MWTQIDHATPLPTKTKFNHYKKRQEYLDKKNTQHFKQHIIINIQSIKSGKQNDVKQALTKTSIK